MRDPNEKYLSAKLCKIQNPCLNTDKSNMLRFFYFRERRMTSETLLSREISQTTV